jgi:hypothetical protein
MRAAAEAIDVAPPPVVVEPAFGGFRWAASLRFRRSMPANYLSSGPVKTGPMGDFDWNDGAGVLRLDAGIGCDRGRVTVPSRRTG